MRLFKTITLCLVTLLLGTSVTAFAFPLMEMNADDLMRQASALRSTLNLTPNQQTLWQQTESKARGILRERQARRARLQDDFATASTKANTELRDVAKKIEAEEQQAKLENTQLRELWLTINDSLDDKQRQLVLQAMNDELQRVDAAPKGFDGAGPRPEGGQHSSGRRKGGMGGGSGGGF